MKKIEIVWEKLKSKGIFTALTITLGVTLLTSASISADSSRNTSNKQIANPKLGQPVLVNTVIDYQLQNISLAVEDLYPTFLPDLSLITGQFNTYRNPELFVNPTDPSNVIVLYLQDTFKDGSGLYSLLSGAGVTAAFSLDGGRTFDHSLAGVPAWFASREAQVLAPSISKNAGSSHASLAFYSDGSMIFSGLFNQTIPALQKPLPSQSLGALSGLFVTKSHNKGASWSDPVVIATSESAAFNPGNSTTATSVISGIGSILVTPETGRRCCGDREITHVTWSNINFAALTLFGNVGYSRSVDRGLTWSSPIVIYDVLNDPVWRANFFNPNFPLGGQAVGAQLVSVPAKRKKGRNVLLGGILRFYPKPGATTYTETPDDTLMDRIVIRSLDNGRTWDPAGIVVGQFVIAFSHDPSTPTAFSLISFDGALNNEMAVSPKTHRVYFAWQAGNPQVNSDPDIFQFFPQIQLSVSADAGLSWTTPVVADRTPFNTTILDANQSFNVSLAVNDKGYLGVMYTDFRNYNGSSEVAANTWLAIYRELKNPKGGPMGNGLVFVKEINLTPSSFDAEVGFSSLFKGIGANNGLASQGRNFLTAFDTTNQNNLPTEVGPFGMTMDVNNRLNIIFEKVSFGKKNHSR